MKNNEGSNSLFKMSIIRCVTTVVCTAVVCASVIKCTSDYSKTVKETAAAQGGSSSMTDDGSEIPVNGTVDPGDGTVTPDQDATSGDGTNASGETTTAAGNASASGGNSSSTTKKDSATSSKPSTAAEILTYFNTSINKVKPSAKSLVKNYEKNSQAGTFELSGPFKVFSGRINKLVEKNMGEKEEDHGRKITTKADIQKSFPVENETWSSKLTTANISSATLAESNGKYVITIKLKTDTASSTTGHNVGNHGKAFSVVATQTILDNAGPVKSLISGGLTIGYRDGKIVATVDPATGNVTHVNYYYVWTLNVSTGGTSVCAPFGLEQDFTINW